MTIRKYFRYGIALGVMTFALSACSQESGTAVQTAAPTEASQEEEENIEDIQDVPVEELEEASAQALVQTGEELQLPAALGGGYSAPDRKQSE